MTDDRKTLEFKVKLNLKGIPGDEWEAIMKSYKRHMLSFEKSLRNLADDNLIAYKILDKIGEVFKFEEVFRLKFSTPEDETLQLVPPRPAMVGQQQPEPFPQAQAPYFASPTTSPATMPFQQQTPQGMTSIRKSAVDQGSGLRDSLASLRESPREESQKKEPAFTFGSGGQAHSAQQDPISAFTAPSATTRSQPALTKAATQGFSFQIPSIAPDSSQTKKETPNISIGADEEDRATGIAILRRKMLMELRKIRNVVEEQSGQDDSF